MHGFPAEPRASASGSGSPELDREPPDTRILESEQGRGDARDGLSATGGSEPVEAAGQDRLPVGKG